MAMNTTAEIIEDIRLGKMVILMDDEDRENEGDLIMAAECVTPKDINFMVTHARGLVCLPMTAERCKRLNLPLMVDNNGAQFSTNFTVSIEAREGVTTGISAADRARTILAAVAPDATANDIVQPGHIFPLIAKEGGVLNRAGHTEAGVDLPRLAGLEPASVIVEILNEDGTMARGPELQEFAKKHDLKIGTIADLIEYRNLNETTIEQVAKCKLPTEYGEFDLVTFKDSIDNQVHFALSKGDINANEPTLVRVHLHNTLSDLLGSERAIERSMNLPQALKRIAAEGGVLVLLGKDEDLLTQVKQFEAEDNGEKPVGAAWSGTSRTVGVGSQILASLGVKKMRLLSRPKKYHALSGYGLEVVEYVD
ncbi:bifunctional 3,4-dihydroxy-2-butanone-4-phosphate synthase/GTP cyclohydrolase II [Paraglaciecola chathamensis]|jgi:3,4-dihydroxy 2-butanone 4-phosphate synthase/GTP cyclohydrolase II|uniref:3,4-dihydroxy-2-butanone 4-phosphate synthase n=3 Tax=Paraglaciecola chathamensis TaxID=368405 RepID=A0A8H9IFK1_9ALTE|nr:MULTISPECIES: bifunctional 3,4-dihydroxy-2-butanone-4-phosphate synthase/GTP cyclohydrolase II [Paraglaciecola]AEE24021.1 3,4-dihydroxy-2-butanone 4-phosphate synthase [Glaciecola sp. 4H-3-7+YE-5]MBN25412.1 bifunctional 3,4-dihydroxy-2-butanone-4-phosphate synthase/GTP cyclohydrolase II [Alteromonadaceae bacterium]MBJ2134852.1 bifunctional 3,4-dihydroxy-2-butanone-4-phosphate synthase/GTP cyclohydrolase II [Paraglaciecola chathamensis]MBU3016736.1 bifunctional 3,4-dihydroxy-2-butanone-4-phos|tara:strand:- start:21727 stop:22824 length:1098 start_codon:yes stop_codon:yes gene_type:complete